MIGILFLYCESIVGVRTKQLITPNDFLFNKGAKWLLMNISTLFIKSQLDIHHIIIYSYVKKKLSCATLTMKYPSTLFFIISFSNYFYLTSQSILIYLKDLRFTQKFFIIIFMILPWIAYVWSLLVCFFLSHVLCNYIFR